MKLNTEELATVLAALRYYQEHGQCDPDNRSIDIHEIATGGDNLASLDVTGVDELCEHLNCNEQRHKIYIEARGGVVQNVGGNIDADVYVLDYDTEDDSPSEFAETMVVQTAGEPTGVPAHLSEWESNTDIDEHAHSYDADILASIEQHLTKQAERAEMASAVAQWKKWVEEGMKAYNLLGSELIRSAHAREITDFAIAYALRKVAKESMPT